MNVEEVLKIMKRFKLTKSMRKLEQLFVPHYFQISLHLKVL